MGMRTVQSLDVPRLAPLDPLPPDLTRYVSPMADEAKLSHLDATGRARMVDVGSKRESDRYARAQARVRMSPETAVIVQQGDAPKGDVLGTARIAGIQAAKRTDELIPLAHPLPLSFVDVEAEIDAQKGTITFIAEARTTARTGVEMEALTACTVAALTAYDMVKGLERGVLIEEVALLQKTGGKEDWSRDT
jgi:cyclic pyranopterin monophosphate synthase